MQHIPDNQCRRCGKVHDELWQITDHEGSWALATTRCECGHHWTMIYTAPANLQVLRVWLARGCEPEEGPAVAVHSHAWHTYRLEGFVPALVPAAS